MYIAEAGSLRDRISRTAPGVCGYGIRYYTEERNRRAVVSLVQLVHATTAEAAQNANERSKYILIYSPKSSTEPLIRDITIPQALSSSSGNSQVVAIWRKDREKEKDKEGEEEKKEVREQTGVGAALKSVFGIYYEATKCSQRRVTSSPFFFRASFCPGRTF